MAEDENKPGDPAAETDATAAKDEAEAGEGSPTDEATAEAAAGEAGEGGEGGDEAAADEDATDAASPEAIAKRVAALGGDDELERIAQDEEAKLAARRERMRKGRGKKGLETAASKRLARIGDGTKKRDRDRDRDRDRADRPASAVAAADPLIERTAQLSRWAKKNQKFVGWLVAGAVVVGGVVLGYNYFQHKKNAEASVVLAQAVADEKGRIGDPAKESDDTNGPKDTSPIFKTADARRDSALEKFRDVQKRFPGTGAALLARLDEASLLLDKKDSDGALAAYNEVKGSPLAQADAEVRGRSIEGIGFVYELKGNLDEALKTYRDLENTDVLGFKELGMYHQARVYEAKGDKDKAKELLKSLHERLTKPGEGHPFPYLEQVTDDRLRALDPTALPPREPGRVGAGGAGGKMSEAQIRQLIEQLKKQGEHGGGGGAGGGGGGGGMPPMPSPRPR